MTLFFQTKSVQNQKRYTESVSKWTRDVTEKYTFLSDTTIRIHNYVNS